VTVHVVGTSVVVVILLTVLSSGGAAADAVELSGTVRDFRSSHPDFEDAISIDPGILLEQLGGDGKPVYAGQTGNPTTHGREAFDQWYRDVPGVNMSRSLTISLQKSAADPGICMYHSSSFFPIDNELFGNEGQPHNYHFTLEIRAEFQYHGGEVFTFTGDDDLWVFINDRLAIDLGGVHGAMSETLSLDEKAGMLGISPNGIYSFALFFAERHTTGSNFKITTSMEFSQQMRRRAEGQMTDVAEEVMRYLETAEPGIILFSGFRNPNGRTSPFQRRLDEEALTRIGQLDGFELIEPATLDRMLASGGRRRSDFVDTAVALRVGGMLHADYIITGTIIEMSESVVIFARVLGAGTGEVLASCQINISREEAAQESEAD